MSRFPSCPHCTHSWDRAGTAASPGPTGAGRSPQWHVSHDSLCLKYFARIGLCDESNTYLDEWEMDTEIPCRDERRMMVTFEQAQGPLTTVLPLVPSPRWVLTKYLGLRGQVTKVLIQAQACSCCLSLGKSYHGYAVCLSVEGEIGLDQESQSQIPTGTGLVGSVREAGLGCHSVDHTPRHIIDNSSRIY